MMDSSKSNDIKKYQNRIRSSNRSNVITGRICPALCEKACVLNLMDHEPTTNREDECAIVVTNKEYKSNTIYGGSPARKIKEGIFFIHDDCHRFLDEDIKKYEYNDTDKYIYTRDNTTIKFEDIENNLRGTSIKDRVDYLNKITLNNDKNRFYIGD